MSEEVVVEVPMSEEELTALAALAAEELVRQEQARRDLFEYWAKTIEGKLTSRMSTRKVKEAQWLESMRLYLGGLATYNTITGEYPFGTRNDSTYTRKPETNITRNKCETAIAQTMAFQFAAGDKNWDLRPPQSGPDLDEHDIQTIQSMQPQGMPPLSPDQVLRFKIDLMEREMENHLEMSDYGIESRKAGWDRVVLGTGIMKAPTNSMQMKKTYRKLRTSDGQILRVPELQPDYIPLIYRVNPWYFFPDDTVTEIKDAEDSIEVHPMSKTQLKELLLNPGYFAEEIEAAIEEEPKNYINSPFNDPAYLTQGINNLKNRYLVLEYHGPMKRKDLLAFGKEPLIDSPNDEYFVEIWVVNSRIIRFEFATLEGCYRCPYAVSVWEPDPATIFGFGIPMLVRDQQQVVNETFKMMLDNAGISAGPQVIVDTTLINPADGGLECTPWKVWYVNEYGSDVTKAIQFFMPQNAFEGLSQLFTMSMGLADTESSVRDLAMNIGAPTGEANSATGMAIMQQSASSPLFYKSEQWDDQITKPIIQALYDWEMQYNKKDEIKASFDIDVRTSTAYLQSTLAQQKLERLRMEIAQGSPAGEWVNMDELVQASLMDMRLPYKNIVKTPQQVAEERANQPPPPPDPNLIKAQAEMAKVELDKQRLALEAQKLQLEANQKHQQAQMEYQAQMRTDEIRSQEAQASVLKAQFDFQAAMAALAAKDDENRQKIMKDIHVENMKLQTQKFLAGIDTKLKIRDQDLTQQELRLKRQGKSGI
jgi:hypothetical protein